jgi:serine/threonine-protein kinase
VLVPVLALFVGAAAAALVLLGVISGQRPQGTAAAVAADTGGGSGVTLVAADYVGHPVDEVAAQLTGLGLTVQRQQDPTSAVAPDTVTRIDPVGVALGKGDPVRVSYAVPLGYAPSSARSPRSGVSTRSTAADAAASTSEAPVTEESTAAGTRVATPTTTATSTSAEPTTTTSTPPSSSSETTSESSSSSSSESSTASASTSSGGRRG